MPGQQQQHEESILPTRTDDNCSGDSPTGLAATQPLDGVRVCHDCDLMVPSVQLASGQKARCPRCSAVLYHHKKNAAARTFAFALAGLILYLPANLLPILTFEMVGNQSVNVMFKGVLMLWQQGYLWMAILVGICSMLMPLVELVLLLMISSLLLWGRPSRLLIQAAKMVRLVAPWGMLDVYMLGILVAMIKMSDLGDLVIGPALVAFILLMLCSVAAAFVYDEHQVWRFIDSNKGRS